MWLSLGVAATLSYLLVHIIKTHKVSSHTKVRSWLNGSYLGLGLNTSSKQKKNQFHHVVVKWNRKIVL